MYHFKPDPFQFEFTIVYLLTMDTGNQDFYSLNHLGNTHSIIKRPKTKKSMKTVDLKKKVLIQEVGKTEELTEIQESGFNLCFPKHSVQSINYFVNFERNY